MLEAIVRGEEPAELLEKLQGLVGEERARLILDRAYAEFEALQQSGHLRELQKKSLRNRNFRLSASGFAGLSMLAAALLRYLTAEPGATYRAPIGLVVIGLILLAWDGMRTR